MVSVLQDVKQGVESWDSVLSFDCNGLPVYLSKWWVYSHLAWSRLWSYFCCLSYISVSAKIWLCSSVSLNVSVNIYIFIILTVSEDENAERLAVASGVHVVISSSGLKHITDNHPNFEKTWDLPVIVKEYAKCGKIFWFVLFQCLILMDYFLNMYQLMKVLTTMLLLVVISCVDSYVQFWSVRPSWGVTKELIPEVASI